MTTTTTISTSTTTSQCSPSSYQLKFNFKSKTHKSQLLFFNTKLFSHTSHSFRVVSCSGSRRESGVTRSSNPQKNNNTSNSWGSPSGNGVNGWLNDHLDDVSQKEKRNGIGGFKQIISGVGFAAVLFGAWSMGRRNSLRARQEMKPLTQQQEVVLGSGGLVHQEEENKINGQSEVIDERSLENDHDIAGNADGSYVSSSNEDSEKTSDVGKTEAAVGVVNSDTDAVALRANDLLVTVPASETEPLNNTDESNTSAAFSVGANGSDLDAVQENQNVSEGGIEQLTLDDGGAPVGISGLEEGGSSGIVSSVAQLSKDLQETNIESDAISGTLSASESQPTTNPFTSRGIPAPILLSSAFQVPHGKVLVPGIVDQTQAQALAALQVLKVIENDAQPGDLCTRREYARWLVSSSSALSRNPISKVYPAMYIENVTELAFDDITPEDPDFTSIQGLAEAGLISSKLSRRDLLSSPEVDIGSLYFHPDSPLSRQDLVSWKMALEKRQLPEAERKILHQLSGFIDIDKIDSDAWPALIADLSTGENGIVALAFGYTRLFQADKPVTKGQAAIALATGEAADIVGEEFARIEAESIAEKAVTAHSALVAEVEKDVNASFEQELLLEREKIDAVQKMAEEATREVERLRSEREAENIALMKKRAGVESEMEILSKLRRDLEEQLESLMSNKVEISYEKERIEKLRKETEEENQAVTRLQYDLEVERKALSMARSWAEDEARRVQEHAKALEEARDRWEKKGIKVVVDEDLREEASTEVTWVNVGKKLAVEETVDRADSLTDKLKVMAGKVTGKPKEIINMIIEKIQLLITAMKEWISKAARQSTEIKDTAVAKMGGSVQELQQQVSGYGGTVKEGAKRVVEDCRGSVEKLTQRFKT